VCLSVLFVSNLALNTSDFEVHKDLNVYGGRFNIQ
jgi:hypothetical protein